jgi:hypothetical protein
MSKKSCMIVPYLVSPLKTTCLYFFCVERYFISKIRYFHPLHAYYIEPSVSFYTF